MKGQAWLNWAAIVTWLVVSLPTLVSIATGHVAPIPAVIWGIAFFAFCAALTVCLGPLGGRARLSVPLLLLEATCGLVMVYISRNGSVAATLVIVAAQVPYALSPAATRWWFILQTLAVAAIIWRVGGWVDGVLAGGALGGFQLFAMATSSLARSERDAREQLSRMNAELTATRGLLAENSRVAERLRISRDLHDTLGHHLTALSLQLDVASRLGSGQAAEHVIEAHAITKLLLSDVRDVVSRLRETSQIDLAGAIRGLTTPASSLEIHLDMPDALVLDDAAQAHALLRCVQEIITNAARHANARNLWIRIERRPDGVGLHARDDGRGAETVAFGNGLTGMRERFAEFAGRVEVMSAAGRGFEIHSFMPQAPL